MNWYETKSLNYASITKRGSKIDKFLVLVSCGLGLYHDILP